MMTVDGVNSVDKANVSGAGVEGTTCDPRANGQGSERAKPKSAPLLYRTVEAITGTLNSETSSEAIGGHNLKRDVAIAKIAHEFFYHNPDMREIMSDVSIGRRRKTNALAYHLSSRNLSKNQAALLMKMYLNKSMTQEFVFPTLDIFKEMPSDYGLTGNDVETYKGALNVFRDYELNSLLYRRLSAPTMVAFGVARGTLSEETATVLVRVYEGVIIARKVPLTAKWIAAMVTTAIITSTAILGVTVVFAPLVIPALIGLAIFLSISAIVFATYLVRGLYEANSQAVIETRSVAESLLRNTDKKIRAAARKEARQSQKGLTHASEWLMELLCAANVFRTVRGFS